MFTSEKIHVRFQIFFSQPNVKEYPQNYRPPEVSAQTHSSVNFERWCELRVIHS